MTKRDGLAALAGALCMERAREEIRAAGGVPAGVLVGPICTCRSFRLPHEVSAHERGLQSGTDWRPWQERYVWNERGKRFELRVEYPREGVK